MNHKVNNVQDLHETARMLYNNDVVGGSGSADSVLNNLKQGIENLKTNWKGKDAGVRILELIKTYNSMVALRNALAQLAVDSSMVAAMYRDIQNANGAGLETLTKLSFEAQTNLDTNYSDVADTIDINPMAEAGKKFVDTAKDELESLKNNAKLRMEGILKNWTAGDASHDRAVSTFQEFETLAIKFETVLAETSTHITTALKNYS